MELKVTHCLYQVIDRHELKYRFSIVCMRKSDRPDTRNIAELKAVQCIRLGDELRMFYVTVAKRREMSCNEMSSIKSVSRISIGVLLHKAALFHWSCKASPLAQLSNP